MGISLDRPNVVGTIHSPGGFRAVDGIPVNAVEIRADILPKTPKESVASLPVPTILTVRRSDEGGFGSWSDSDRESLYLTLLPAATAIDVELRSLKALPQAVRAARKAGKTVIVSSHDFEGTPSLARLRRIVKQGREAGADIVKIATLTEKPSDVAHLLELLGDAIIPVAVMGMGRLGRASRLLLAKAGSVLNYGWLAKPQVSGQWSAREFARLLARA